jgi:hypothetical protein
MCDYIVLILTMLTLIILILKITLEKLHQANNKKFFNK